jgi:hypothetical protein
MAGGLRRISGARRTTGRARCVSIPSALCSVTLLRDVGSIVIRALATGKTRNALRARLRERVFPVHG